MSLRIPPVVVAFAALGLMWGVAYWSLGPTLVLPGRRAVAIGFVVLGFAAGVAGVLAFRRAQTTVDPVHPERASALVTRGVYRLSRNPMYLGLALGLVGAAVWLAHPVGLLGVALFVGWMERFQIRPEERAMEARFGEPYRAYRARVRRWI